ncbi:E3 ubiquitin-protein ligase ATL31-like [Bidens hawaiensis]|uniref:E3 ubiquitin-protein ligase ATL31-like n=1 Tax=Bidens hawaiensis TaxID=980011 RepID=UPI00404A8F8A
MAMEDPIESSSNSQTLSTSSFLTPLLVSIMGIGVTALAILFYHMLLVRYCIRRHAERMAALRTFAGEDIAIGVDEKTLKTIPIITYKKPESEQTDQSECTVCLADMEDGDTVRLLPNCKHLFHVKCIDEWFVGHTSCPVCRVPVGAATDDVGSCSGDRHGGLVEVDDGRRRVLRHCHSLVLPGEKKKRFTGMELKRSLSMGQSNCVVVDINITDNIVDKDCVYYMSFKDESVRQIQRVSSKVKQSFSRMCVGQGQESGILPY